MKIVVVSESLNQERQRLQPHRTLIEMGLQLERAGHEVVLVSDGTSGSGATTRQPIRHVRTVRKHTRSGNRELIEVLESEAASVVLWHVSITGLVHQDPRLPFATRPIAVVTSPVHRAGQILRLGPQTLASNLELVGIQLSDAVLPAALVRHRVSRVGWDSLITLSGSTRERLVSMGIPSGSVSVVPPGVSARWLRRSISDEERAKIRAHLGYGPSDVVATYFGSPAPVRGIFTLLRAVENVARSEPRLRLMVLSRRTPDQWHRQAKRLRWWATKPSLEHVVRLEDAFLTEPELVERIVASDIVFLPFEVVPSDVPLSILEAMALSKCVVSTPIGCIPELVRKDRGILVEPGSVRDLEEALRAALAAPHELAMRGRRAHDYVSHHRTWDQMGLALEHALKIRGRHDATER